MIAEDTDLLAGLRARDARAYEAWLRGEGAWMLGLARRILGDEAEAEDAVQDGCLRAFRGIDGFQGACRLSTWLHRIVVRSALARLRSRTRRRRAECGARAAGGRRGRPDDADALASTMEARDTLRAAVERLPTHHRVAFVLSDVEGLPLEEVADLLGLTLACVKSRVHRARRALRAALAPRVFERHPFPEGRLVVPPAGSPICAG